MTKFKLDEHFGRGLQNIFVNHGYDADTVSDENLNGTSDHHLFEVCKQESRCLVTLDLDFSDIIRFPPYKSPGIIVLRPRKKVTLEDLEILVMQIIKYLESDSITNRLWVVEPGRIRIHSDKQENDFG